MTDRFKEYGELLAGFHEAISRKQLAGENLKEAKRIFDEAEQALQIAESKLNDFEKEYV